MQLSSNADALADNVRIQGDPRGAPLLTIAIPTWNRAGYLARNLAQLHSELRRIAPGLVEVVVSDNCSSDETPAVVEQAHSAGLSVHYVRNPRNMGWAFNFAQCFELATATYVVLLGDDDVFVDGALTHVVSRLSERTYGVVCLGSYGYDEDFRAEYPGVGGTERLYTDPNQFLVAIGPLMTLISACIVNKSMLSGVETQEFSSGDLGVVHLVLRAALIGRTNLFISKYLIAGKRQNSFAYEFADVFVRQLWEIIDAHKRFGLNARAIERLQRNMMLSYYPFYLFDLRLSKRGNLKLTHDYFEARFGHSILFKYWLAPTIRLPRPLALVWGAATTFAGRVLGGELRRGVMFAWHRLARVTGRLMARATS